jgi:hypothetical protein
VAGQSLHKVQRNQAHSTICCCGLLGRRLQLVAHFSYDARVQNAEYRSKDCRHRSPCCCWRPAVRKRCGLQVLVPTSVVLHVTYLNESFSTCVPIHITKIKGFFHDCHAFVRSSALQVYIWTYICCTSPH